MGKVIVVFIIANAVVVITMMDRVSKMKPQNKDGIIITETNRSKLITVEHDGHIWVMPYHRGGVVHHPDCGCKKIEP